MGVRVRTLPRPPVGGGGNLSRLVATLTQSISLYLGYRGNLDAMGDELGEWVIRIASRWAQHIPCLLNHYGFSFIYPFKTP